MPQFIDRYGVFLRIFFLKLLRVTFFLILVTAPALLVFYSGAFLLNKKPSMLVSACSEEKSQFIEFPQPFPVNMIVNGIAWGDYDNDGRDDLFVASYPAYSSTTEFSKVYKNTERGFVDVTAMIGLPSFLSSSGFFVDYDNDGWLDLFVVEAKQKMPSKQQLALSIRVFRNIKGNFKKEITAEVGLDRLRVDSTNGTLTFVDFDNDGRLDMVGSFLGATRRYSNAGLSRKVLEPKRGIMGSVRMVCGEDMLKQVFWEEPVLAQAIEGDFTREIFLEKGCINVFRQVAPGSHIPIFSNKQDRYLIYANLPGELHILRNAKGVFKDIGPLVFPDLKIDTNAVLGMSPWNFLSHRFFQPIPIDFNHDNLYDLFVAVDFGKNLLLQNNGNFKFKDVTDISGFSIFGNGMGVALGDISRRGILDMVVTNVGHVFLFRGGNKGFGLDANESLNSLGLGWGVVFIDSENDGWPDLYITNGDVLSNLNEEVDLAKNELDSSSLYKINYTADRFYKNENGHFADKSNASLCIDTSSTRSVATADFDGNGYEDFAIGTTRLREGRGVTIFQNQGGDNHYIKIKLHGRRSNFFGVGSLISVITSDGSKQTQSVIVGDGFNAQNSLTKIFGVGSETSPLTVEIRWPSGVVQRIPNVPVDVLNIVQEPE